MEIIYTHWQNRSIENIDGEIWKYIYGCSNRYSISNFGRVKSNRILQGLNKKSILNLCPFILKQYKDKNNYLKVCIRYTDKDKFRLVHVLVALSFKLNPNNKKEVHHIKNVRTYNHESNLEWNTRIENNRATVLNIGKEYKVVDIIKPDNSKYTLHKSKKDKSFIYGIADHKNNIVYVGKSNNPILRFRQHKTWARNDSFVSKFRLQWLRNIMENGEPSIIILKEVKKEEWQKWEKYYIAYFKSKGNTLHNITSGGNDISANSLKAFNYANELRKKQILQYDLFGNFIKQWESTRFAAFVLGMNHQAITRVLKNRRISAGEYLWLYKTSNEVSEKINCHPRYK